MRLRRPHAKSAVNANSPIDLRLNEYHRRLDEAVSHWVHGEGASFQFNAAHHELAVVRRLVGNLDGWTNTTAWCMAAQRSGEFSPV